MKSAVLTAMNIKIMFIRNPISCSVVGRYQGLEKLAVSIFRAEKDWKWEWPVISCVSIMIRKA
jgi:hypothetical protein